MRPLALALKYMEIFYGGSDIEALRPLFAKDLTFEGPFYTFDSAEAYLDSLRKEPPEGLDYELLQTFEKESHVCLIYQFSKPGISIPMAQLFEIENDKISKIILIFDTGAFP